MKSGLVKITLRIDGEANEALARLAAESRKTKGRVASDAISLFAKAAYGRTEEREGAENSPAALPPELKLKLSQMDYTGSVMLELLNSICVKLDVKRHYDTDANASPALEAAAGHVRGRLAAGRTKKLSSGGGD